MLCEVRGNEKPALRAVVGAALLLCSAPASLCGASASELRGLWLHGTQIRTRAETQKVVATLTRAHFNAAFVLVWYWGGRAYFRTPDAEYAPDIEQGFDPLKAFVALCHREGIEVHAWFVNGAYGAPQLRGKARTQPQYFVQSGGGPLWYDLARPEVQTFQKRLMLQCLKNYDIDGLHFDYIRFGQRYCYCGYCREAFSKRSGLPPLSEEDQKAFPCYAHLSGNPLRGRTTAQVVVRFGNGIPAVAVNPLGKGRVVLLNWHAEGFSPPQTRALVRAALAKWKLGAHRAWILNTAENRARYGSRFAQSALRSFLSLGIHAQACSGASLPTSPSEGFVVAPCVYVLPEQVAKKLLGFAQKGGTVFIIDGPVRSMHLASVRRLVGMKEKARYFSGETLLVPSGKSDLIVRRARPLPRSQYKKREAAWAVFRKASVTSFVRAVSRGAKKCRASARISAAVFTPLRAAEGVFQDWPRWVREGIVDFVVPMAYTMDNEDLSSQIAEWKTVDWSLRRIIPGLSLYKRVKGRAQTRSVRHILSQLALCRRHGARGTVFFSLHYLSEALCEALRTGPFSTQAAPYYPPARREGPPRALKGETR